MKIIFIIILFFTSLFASEQLEKISPKLKLIYNKYNTSKIKEEGKKHKLENINNFIYKSIKHLKFTQEELNYIKTQKIVKICVDPDWMPLEKIDKDGNYIGIISDYAKLILKDINIEFLLQSTKNYEQSLEYLKSAQCDMIMADSATKEIKKYFLVTKPYFISPRAYITHIDTPWVRDFSQFVIKNTKIGVSQNSPAQTILKENYKGINIVPFDSIENGLKAVSSKQIIAYVNIIPAMVYAMQNSGITNIKVSGYLNNDVKLSIIVNKNLHKLVPILNKAIDNIKEQDRANIFDKWIKIKFEKQIDYLMIRKIGIAFFIFLIFIITILFILRKNNKKQHKLINSTIEGIIVLKNGVCVESNQQALKLLGYENFKEIKNKCMFTFIAPRFKKITKVKLETSTKPYECELIKKDGTYLQVLAKGSYLYDDKSVILSTFIDLSELKSVQKELEDLNSSLEDKVKIEVEKNRRHQLIMPQQSKFAQMGETISMIAHQWRQPLNTLSMIIQGTVFKYKRGLLTQELISKFDKNSKNQIEQMSNTIDDFRSFFRPGKDKIQINVANCVNKAVNILSPSLKNEKIELTVNIEENISLEGYPNELGQSIINILNNSKDALVENNVDREKNIHISLRQTSEDITIHVEDNAGGIPIEIIDDIFNPYFSTKSEKNGTGLGLYMIKIIIEEHMKGSVKVENKNNGAIFSICFKKEVKK